MRRLTFTAVLASCLITSFAIAGTAPGARKSSGSVSPSKTTVNWAARKVQGFNMQVWISNQMCLGLQAWDAGSGEEIPEPPPFGLEYPVGSLVEHVYGAGPWVGGKVNGQRRVTEGYNGNSADKYFVPDPARPLRERIWVSDANQPNLDLNFSPERFLLTPANRRGCDDDGDGRIDEDDLDGLDNDGDWVMASDDVGSDGVSDTGEVGCQGPYGPGNLDPAFDNYDPSKRDICHPNSSGAFPRMGDLDAYTEKNGLADHGEPHVDEDYAAFSDNDLYCSATDLIAQPGHSPMGIKIVQKSYAWRGLFAEGVLPIDYYFINVGNNQIRDVYVGFFADLDVGPTNKGTFWTRNYACYYESLRTAYVHNAIDREATPLGVTVLNTPRALDSLDYIFQWFDFTTRQIPCTSDDSCLYGLMSGEAFPEKIAQCQSPTTPSDCRFIFSFGKFDNFNPGDTLKISIALVSGEGLEQGANNMKSNAEKAIRLYKRGYVPPIIPPSPSLDAEEGFKRVTLKWGGGIGPIDPLEVWDDSNKLAQSYPDTHWRRQNPPCSNLTPGGCSFGHVCTIGPGGQPYLPGGRIFEGYRLYRSEFPGDPPPASSFTLLREFDMKDDEYGYNVGLDSGFVDSNLVRGKRYWYSVTSFGIPDIAIIERPNPSGTGIIRDTLLTESAESSVLENKQRVDLSFSASNNLGEVLVVPNPYRVDGDYTYENGGWEGRGRLWDESKRLIKFIHLPKKCTIRVFTMAGDLVATMDYQSPQVQNAAGQIVDSNEGELEWNLLSESNRALASGLYVFSVESDLGRQIGKFVLIR